MDMNIEHTCVVHDLVVTIQICHGPTIPTVDRYNVQYCVPTHVAGRIVTENGHVSFSFRRERDRDRGRGCSCSCSRCRELIGSALVLLLCRTDDWYDTGLC